MYVHIVENPGKGPGINIHGDAVTPFVHGIFSTVMATNHINDPWYIVRSKAAAFFQGGHDRPDGNWVFIEFWNRENAQPFVDKINNVLKYVNKSGVPLLLSVTPTLDRIGLLKGLLDYYEVEYQVNDMVYNFTPNDPCLLLSLVDDQEFGHLKIENTVL